MQDNETENLQRSLQNVNMKTMKMITMDLSIQVSGMPAPPEPNHEKNARERKVCR